MVMQELVRTDRYAVPPCHGEGKLRRELARVLAGESPSRAVRGEIVDSWKASASVGLTPDRFDLPFEGPSEKDCSSGSGRDAGSRPVGLRPRLHGDQCRPCRGSLPSGGSESPWAARGGTARRAHALAGIRVGHRPRGTNGLSAAFANGAPILVQGEEHFANALTTMATAGAPIHDPRTAQVLGVLAFVCSAGGSQFPVAAHGQPGGARGRAAAPERFLWARSAHPREVPGRPSAYTRASGRRQPRHSPHECGGGSAVARRRPLTTLGLRLRQPERCQREQTTVHFG